MQDFLQVKNKIYKLFSDREGFSDEIIEAITATYIYLDEQYKDIVDDAMIPDAKDFMLKSKHVSGRSLANIYLNRVFKNVQKIETVSFNQANEYIASEKKVLLSEENIQNRIKHWSFLKLNPEEEQTFTKKLRAKIIVHELIHAGSDNGLTVGFNNLTEDSVAVLKILNQYFKDNQQISPSMSRLEEMITEVLAVNIVGFDNIAQSKTERLSFCCKNIDSSNAPIYCIADNFMRTFPDVVKGKFVDPMAYLAEFTNEYSSFGLYSKKNCLYTLNNYLRDISTFARKVDSSTFNAVRQRYEFFQVALLDVYNKNLEINSEQDLKKAIDDFVAFEAFSYKVDGKREDVVQEKLDRIMKYCNTYCKQNGYDFIELYTKASNNLYNIDKSTTKKEAYCAIKGNDSYIKQ